MAIRMNFSGVRLVKVPLMFVVKRSPTVVARLARDSMVVGFGPADRERGNCLVAERGLDWLRDRDFGLWLR